MTRQEWLKLYSHVRRTEREFNEHMATANYPCGHDDMLAEGFDNHREEWLKDKPELRQVLADRWEWSYYEEKEECLNMSYHWSRESRERALKDLIKQKFAA